LCLFNIIIDSNKLENSCIVGLSLAGYLKLDWTIGTAPHQIKGICKTLFVRCYNTTRNCVEDICAEIKKGESSEPFTAFGDRSNTGSRARKSTLSRIIEYCDKKNIILTKEQMAMVNIPNTDLSLKCYCWLRSYFNMIGDCEPNTDGEIHLEPCSIKDIYFEYVTDQRMQSSDFLRATQFSDMWKTCFP